MNDPPLRIAPVDRCAFVSASCPPMLRTDSRLTRARALGEVGRVNDHVGGVGELERGLESRVGVTMRARRCQA